MTVKKLDNLCDFISGLWTGKKPPYIKVSVIRNTNFHKSGNLDFSDIAGLNVEAKQFSTRQLRFGDIILEKSGGGPKQPVGRVCVFEKQEGLFSLSNFTSAIRIKNPRELDYKYLHYYLKHLYIMGETEKIQTNSTGIRNLQLSLYKEFLVPLPSLKIQQTIVTKLDRIFAEIDKATVVAEANTKNAEALFQNFLKQAFKSGGKDWEVFKIKDLIKIRSGDFLPAKNMNSKGSIDVYGGNGISGKHDLQNLSGDNIIIGRVGAKCGNVRLVRGNIWVTDNAFYVSEFKKNINKEFLSLALELKNLRTLANQMAQPVISFATIKDTELKIPNSLEKQVKFLKIKNRLELQIKILNDSNIKKTNSLNLLKQSILKKAFNDELVKAA